MAKRTYRNVEDIIALIQNSESECEDDVHDEDDVESVDSDDNSQNDPEQQEVASESGSDDVDVDMPSDTDLEAEQFTASDGTVWRKEAPRQSRARSQNILREAAGLKPISQNTPDIKHAFELFLSEAILQIVVEQTNNYGSRLFAEMNQNKEENNRLEWMPTDTVEMQAFCGILLLAGVFKSKRENIRDLWTTEGLFARPVFVATMARNRFLLLYRCCRFDDATTRQNRVANDKLAAFREVIEHFAESCRSAYAPGPNVTVDEHLCTFRGRCGFIVYMPSKPGKYGIKIWMCCDSDNFYCSNLQVYCGKVGNAPERGQGERVTLDLTSHLFGSGRNVTTDNFFTSVSLSQKLLQKSLTLVGTVRKGRAGFPQELFSAAHREEKSSLFMFTPDTLAVSYIPKRGKTVTLMSTMHLDKAVADEEAKYKPEVVLYYNKTKSGVDVLDKLVREYSCKRATKRWPMALFMDCIDIAAYNALVIWSYRVQNDATLKGIESRRQFLKDLGCSLVKSQMERRSLQFQNDRRGCDKQLAAAFASCGYPLPPVVPRPAVNPLRLKRGRCQMCDRTRDRKTSVTCNSCNNFCCDEHSVTVKTVTCDNCQAEADKN